MTIYALTLHIQFIKEDQPFLQLGITLHVWYLYLYLYLYLYISPNVKPVLKAQHSIISIIPLFHHLFHFSLTILSLTRFINFGMTLIIQLSHSLHKRKNVLPLCFTCRRFKGPNSDFQMRSFGCYVYFFSYDFVVAHLPFKCEFYHI